METESLRTVSFSVLPALILGLPALGAAAAAFAGEKRARLRNWIAVATSGITMALVIWMVACVFSRGSVYFNLNIMHIGDRFVGNLEVDALGAFFALFAAILWFAASMHSFKYMEHEQKRTRFYFFLLLAEAATLGVFMVQDFFTLYLFFEAMGLIAYVLVVHSETPAARSAAAKYIILTVFGGLLVLGGIFLYLGASGTISFVPLTRSAWLTGSFRIAALVALVLGFGVKAGMVPVHVWLPDAHPAAPSPASALLSGVMIKVGAYGILRTVLTFFQSPLEQGPALESGAHGAAAHGVAAHAAEAASHGTGLAGNVQMLGFAILVIAVVTMIVGMVMALIQRDIKRTLAYSSISQMGYILFGIGCMGFLGSEGVMGMTGSIYHIINHAFFKGCLFLAAGSILFCAHELDMFKLGGLWRKMPLTTVFWSIATLGIMGITLFNGFVSKTLLHHAIVESHELALGSHLLTAGWLKAAEVLFIIVSGGTIGYMGKMTYYVFFKRPSPEHREHLEHVKEAPAWMLAGTGLLATGVLFLGLFPGLVLTRLMGHVTGIVPAFGRELVEEVAKTPIFVWANIKEILVPIGIGAAVFLAGAWPDLFHARRRGPDIFAMRLPGRLGVDYWYARVARGSLAFLFRGRRGYASFKETTGSAVGRWSLGLSAVPPANKAGPEFWVGATAFSRSLTAARDFYHRGMGAAGKAAGKGFSATRSAFARAFAGENLSRDMAIGTLIIALVLVALLILRLA